MLKQSLQAFINENCGGVATVSKKVNLTERAIYKWTANNSLPRTEFSGETKYSKVLSDLSGVSEQEIKESFKPQPST